MIPVVLVPVDACQSPDCHPGVSGPCVPVGPVEETTGGQVADFECPCGEAWTTEFDEFGWVVERTAAPVAEGREAA